MKRRQFISLIGTGAATWPARGARAAARDLYDPRVRRRLVVHADQSWEERHVSALRIVRRSARRSARCFRPAAISCDARRPCRAAGSGDHVRTAERCTRSVRDRGQVHRPGVAAGRCDRNHPGNVVHLAGVGAAPHWRFDAVQGPTDAGFLRHQGDGGRQLLGDDRQRFRRQEGQRRRAAHVPPHQARLEGRNGAAPCFCTTPITKFRS
jgi:hypothetical protein